ncbi:MAG: hypothetical protein AB1611_12625 [bacterium]
MAARSKTKEGNAGRMSSRGEVTFTKLVSYTDEKLKEYFHDRLTEKELNPSLNINHDEVPEDFLIGFYQSGDETSKARCKEIVKELLQELLIDEINNRNIDNCYLSRLLYLCDIFVVEEAMKIVLALAQEGRFINQHGCYGDIHEQLLKNLIFMQGTRTEDINLFLTPFWLSYIENPLYTGAAFFGLCKSNCDKAIEKLPVLVKAASESPEKYDLKFMLDFFIFFIDECGGGEPILPRIGESLRYASLDIKEKILAIVKELKYSPQAIKEFERKMDCIDHFVNKIIKRYKVKKIDKDNKMIIKNSGIRQVAFSYCISELTDDDPTSEQIFSRHRSEIADQLKQNKITLSPKNVCSRSIR